MSELIRRDDALHIVDVAEDEHPYKVPGLFVTYSEYNQGWSDAVDFIRSRMEKADAVPTAPRWVRCEEEPPKEEYRTYLVYTDTGYMCSCRWTNNMYGLGESDRWGWSIADVPQFQKVTHWMPIEPPKEGV